MHEPWADIRDSDDDECQTAAASASPAGGRATDKQIVDVDGSGCTPTQLVFSVPDADAAAEVARVALSNRTEHDVSLLAEPLVKDVIAFLPASLAANASMTFNVAFLMWCVQGVYSKRFGNVLAQDVLAIKAPSEAHGVTQDIRLQYAVAPSREVDDVKGGDDVGFEPVSRSRRRKKKQKSSLALCHSSGIRQF